ncbi:hypothetical protein KEM52_005184 [Ascosphaera acerosa]|nr:hypothetical protein KEM52_005184 [Ascosphaera acerosa]
MAPDVEVAQHGESTKGAFEHQTSLSTEEKMTPLSSADGQLQDTATGEVRQEVSDMTHICPDIYGDIGGADRYIWFVIGHLVSIAAVCPFVGNMSDLMGRRYLALVGAVFCIVGMIVCATANVMNVFIGGMVIAGVGAGINELTALAATSEMAPAKQRGTYNAVLVLTILPFMPAGIYANLLSYYHTWRYVAIIPGVWNALGFVMVACFYFPPPRVNTQGLSRREILKSIDYGGGFLFISGIIVFLAGIQWGGYQYEWTSAHVLAPLFIGFALIVAFVVYEFKVPRYPIIPRGFADEKVNLALTMLITFIAGCNFFAFIMFWPTQSVNVYGDDPLQVGIRTLPIAFGILGGATIGLWLLSVLKGAIRELLVFCCVIMTIGTGGMAYAEVDNLHKIWGFLIVGSVGIGGIVVPASIIATIICPDDLIATVSALTMSVRMIGGAIGYTIYYNVFVNKFEPKAVKMIGGTMLAKLNITDQKVIEEAIQLCASSLIEEVKLLPGVRDTPGAWEMIIAASRQAFAESYKYVYYVSIAFGSLALISSLFLTDIRKHMDNHIAVVMH